MNRKSILVATAIAAAAFAASAENYEDYNKPIVSTASRTAVQHDAVQAARSANLWSASYNPLAQFRSTTTRAQVRADYLASRDVVDAFTGEDSGSGYPAVRPAAAGESRIAAR